MQMAQPSEAGVNNNVPVAWMSVINVRLTFLAFEYFFCNECSNFIILNPSQGLVYDWGPPLLIGLLAVL